MAILELIVVNMELIKAESELLVAILVQIVAVSVFNNFLI